MKLRHAITSLATAVLWLAVAADPARSQLDWTWPIGAGLPVVVRAFDPPAQPWRPGHRGVDIAGHEGAPIRAAGAGMVTYAGLVAGVGIVTVTHGELRTTYQPVAAIVRTGMRVDAGQQIGTLTVTGSHCAPSPCLHWGLLSGDTYLDPISLLPSGQPRLLPLGASALGLGQPADASVSDRAAVEPTAGNTGWTMSERAAIGAVAGVGAVR